MKCASSIESTRTRTISFASDLGSGSAPPSVRAVAQPDFASDRTHPAYELHASLVEKAISAAESFGGQAGLPVYDTRDAKILPWQAQNAVVG